MSPRQRKRVKQINTATIHGTHKASIRVDSVPWRVDTVLSIHVFRNLLRA